MKTMIGRGIALLCCAIALGQASPAAAESLGGVAACALIEGVPGAAHPLRKHPALKPLFASLDAAGHDRGKNARVLERLDKLLTPLYLEAERAFLTILDGSCRTPIAGHARLIGDDLEIRGLVLRPDGSESLEAVRRGSPDDAAALGREAGSELRSRMPPDFLKA